MCLCVQLVIGIMDVTKSPVDSKSSDEDLSEGEKAEKEREKEKVLQTLSKLIQPCVDEINEALDNGK